MDTHGNGDHNKLFEGFGEVKGILKGLDDKLDQVLTTVNGHDQRIRQAEGEIAKAKGWGAAMGLISGIAVSIGAKFIGK